MKLIIVFTLFVLSSQAFTSECEKYSITSEQLQDAVAVEKMPEAVLAHYQQIQAADVDVIGDFSLFKKAASTPKKIFWTLRNEQDKRVNFWKTISDGAGCAKELFPAIYQQNDQEILTLPNVARSSDLETVLKSNLPEDQKAEIITKLQSSKIYIEGHKNPLKVDQFVEMIGQIIIEEEINNINPSYGKPHEWSAEFKKSSLARKSVMAKFSKLLLALSRGETSQYILSGTEKELESWILSQELNSILPHEMIRASYVINKGDMYLTLLTIENVLNRYWRHNNRAALPVTVRLKTIINSFGSEGDKFGSWYHLFGMALYGYVEGSLKATTIGNVETIGSHILDHFADEKQEDYINSKGGIIGGKIAKMIRKKSFETLESKAERLNADYYLDLTEDFSDRIAK